MAESLRVAHASGALRSKDLKRVTMTPRHGPPQRTLVPRPKPSCRTRPSGSPTAWHRVRLRQSPLRIAKRAAMMAGR
jgi:IS5 family transposase